MTLRPTPAVVRARRLLAEPERDTLRIAKQQRRAAHDEYTRALDAMQPRPYVAVRAYVAALHAEAAANRAEAHDLRAMLTAVVTGETGAGT